MQTHTHTQADRQTTKNWGENQLKLSNNLVIVILCDEFPKYILPGGPKSNLLPTWSGHSYRAREGKEINILRE